MLWEHTLLLGLLGYKLPTSNNSSGSNPAGLQEGS
jgi:hypothetical protein